MYYIHNEGGSDLGPYTLDHLTSLFKKGELLHDRLVRIEGKEGWTEVSKIVTGIPLYHLYSHAEAVGPFTLGELEEKVRNAEIQSQDLVRFQGPNGLNWRPVSEVLRTAGSTAVAPMLTRIPPKSDTHCFVTMGGTREGPYVQDQIRSMWQTGLITADALVDWDNCVKPLPVTTLMQASAPSATQQATAATAPQRESTDIFAILCFATGLAGLVILPYILTPIAYVTGIISYYRLRENPHLKGRALRITGAICASLSLFWLWYTFRYTY